MKFHDRYIKGECKQVYDGILQLGQDAFLPDNLTDIEKVLEETFQRASFNLEIIYSELQRINYNFKTSFTFNFERPLHKPLPNTNLLLKDLDNTVAQFGFVPLSLKYFYKIVGGVNFVWDYETNENLMWEQSDAIQVASLDSVTDDEDWTENMEDFLVENQDENVFLELAPDNLHKDNISGGAPYSLEITKTPSIDSKFLNEPNDTTFINYLRICFEYCGFPGMRSEKMNADFHAFISRIKPHLKPL